MKQFYILKGIPGSGKSTWAKQFVKKEKTWRRVNKDDIRTMLYGDDYDFSVENENLVDSLQDALIRKTVSEGFNVVIDNTHLTRQSVKKLNKIAESIGDIQVMEKAFNVSMKECIARNDKRMGRSKVPQGVIERMAKAAGGNITETPAIYYPPLITGQSIEHDPLLPNAIICDLDGTLAKIGDRSPYDASRCDIVDHPNYPVIKCVLAMYAQDYDIIFMSGRDSKYKEPTRRFIEQWCINPKTGSSIFYELYMRAENDSRKDSIVKQELFDEHVRGRYNILFSLDDRDQIVRKWREMGLTCFQVDFGDF